MSILGKLPHADVNPRDDDGMPKDGDAVVVCRADGSTSFYLLGIDHERLTYRHSGRDYRLTDIAGNVVHEIIA